MENGSLKNILITGLSGFVGSNIQKYLNDTYNIRPLKVRYNPEQKIKINADIVIHLAGKAHDLKKVSAPNEYYEANFELTRQVFDAFLCSDATVFIFMSTVKAVADEVVGILNEESLPNPKTHYGITKRKAEEYILAKEIPKEKRVYILRPCMIHGEGNKGNLNLLYKLVAKGIPWPLGAFQNQRSFLSIENLCFVIKSLLENETVSSGIYQVSDNKAISTNELIKLLGDVLGKKSRIWTINALFVKKMAKIGDVLCLPLNSERLKKLTENYIVSNEKIVRVLGEPLPVSTDSGLTKTFKSFKKTERNL